ncbi:DEHA2C07194p [Debaryomyces hansenii CBS767]|uniref:DEHA2C07194p n=1 Tax=Debaryomyces hansenii (strain ATCC 36239 / CBS 767 / BCRC 21394 / JCM 1990 / NBRC 0083 / IGC 2968) TaxID=284592 RepID=Q6BUX4_DEBHA|nr:DEHA2C07194p [Debaryomyces hansenii CBS767]CAG86053.2 DEHA2C07194p [Debaryomyces hansenii CBS767]|eukprot:XP_457995.2 DEHA2C07194p [Debaryomyces hansenii CBS767]
MEPKEVESTNSESIPLSNGVSSRSSTFDDKKEHTKWQSFKDSFKRYEGYEEEEEVDLEKLDDIQKGNIRTAKSPLKRKLKSRHLQMIAIGSSIGTGLFIGSGSALNTGGPLGILIAWALTGSAIFCTIQAMGELAVTFPISGSFNVYASRFIDPSVGFAVAWNYFFQFLVLLPLELVAGSITMTYWITSVNPDVWVLIFYLVVISINFFGVKAYGEAEFVFSSIKVLAVVGFIIVSIVIAAGGAPNGHYVGDRYWHDPGLFANGFKGVSSVFVTSAFSFGGTELVGLTAAETDNPRVTLPRATKQVFWRILMFYMISLTLICFLVPYNSDSLLGASSVDVTASPFVIAINNGGIGGLPSVMNAVILISVISVGSSSVYATSRTLTALAEQGLAPKICGYIDRAGRPLVAIIITNIFGLLSFIAASGKQEEVFNWLLSISGLSSIFTWWSICVAHIRFRRALYVKGRSSDELSFKSQTGVIGSIYGATLNTLVLIAEFWVSLFPLGESPSAEGFFQNYLGFVVLLVFYVGHKIWKNNWILCIRAKNIDVDVGRRETDLEALKQELEEERAILRTKPLYYRVYRFWC